ncbi:MULTISPECIES: [FeFe] hydrogenase H-cluster radical SAM maturase HydE [unclassified Pseudodesulfovibrio]|uniref:[FeFe] hydrogenase H-cluster radical SAM maturase HydE n=1 Tax=unclassified Pseudodesulfovibrio TaxID=2661612 RepID=UPI000FEBFBAB|nr:MULTISPECIES: [FeFe] hydrogenase H-cluster radical SAM maturase HydE [unclassified Pseudodesulfovibrio]MCJ2164375.1 [FeFe] hydrogenase H-cluster radical SAM maturase HydE [Pseudodesulfovibrio sp. S3-i]RWU04583.1 [FeFe] hydrogenase H-cluster radical SAM maturase HydE [Pseudodesulfovibrio sp. S3]
MNAHDILTALTGADDPFLFARANETRKWVFGNEVHIRAIVEFSNICDKHCRYCGLRADNRNLHRYRMSADNILAAASDAVSQGAGTVVLQSGDDMGYSTETLGELIGKIKARHDVAVTLSLGDRGLDEYAFWRDCGADRCLIKLETTDQRLYKHLRRGEDFSARLHRVERLRRMGYEIGSGVIVGLPDTDLSDGLRDILFLTDLELDMIAVGPFVPNPDTPLTNTAPGSVTLSHRTSALLRLLNPKANIPATSALDALRPGSRALALTRGCNVLMPSMTPARHRGDYTIYPGKNAGDMDDGASLDAAHQTIRATGFIPSAAKGFSPRRSHVG